MRLAEGNDGTTHAVFTITRSSSAGRATVTFTTAAGSATVASGDYQAVAGTLTFLTGETRKTVAVAVNGDRLGESDESFVLNLSNPAGAVIADGQGRANIRDDEPRIHAAGLLAFPEGDAAMTLQLAVNLSVPSSETVTVNFATADLTATAGSDYVPTSGVLTFPPGETRKLIDITLRRDLTQEAIVEAFAINLNNASGNAVILKRGVVHIVDDDTNSGKHFGHRNGILAAASGGFASPLMGARELALPPFAEPNRFATQGQRAKADNNSLVTGKKPVVSIIPEATLMPVPWDGKRAPTTTTSTDLVDLVLEKANTCLLEDSIAPGLLGRIRG